MDTDTDHQVASQLVALLRAGRFAEFISAAEALGPLDPALSARRDTLVGHARLALAQDRDAEIAVARARETTSRWLTTAPLLAWLGRAVQERRPAAFVRLGDGEARFVVTMTPELRPTLSAMEALAISRPVWETRFHERIDHVDPTQLLDLFIAFREAVSAADVLGVSGVERLVTKPNIVGYLVAQEIWLRKVLAGRGDVHFADALEHHRLDIHSPFLADLLTGLDFLGVIGPHPGLANVLGSRFGIATIQSYPVPGESLLLKDDGDPVIGRHFPDVYRNILATLSVPARGAVFLVAAGLLGKIYCARIKRLGGIALDIGSVADLWMGFDTRPGYPQKPLGTVPTGFDVKAAMEAPRTKAWGHVDEPLVTGVVTRSGDDPTGAG